MFVDDSFSWKPWQASNLNKADSITPTGNTLHQCLERTPLAWGGQTILLTLHVALE